MRNKLIIEDWGRIDYQEAWDRQTVYQQKLVDLKRTARKSNLIRTEGQHFLILCEHNPVYTLGKSGKDSHLLVDQMFLQDHGISYFKINRGGDITYHGPGQLVVYPILDLEFFYTDIHRYIRSLEEAVIRTLSDYEIEAYRIAGFTGVWTGSDPARKICAIGVHMSRWVSMHGLAFNINTEISYFDHIVPCGIDQAGMNVTSIARELQKNVDFVQVKSNFVRHFTEIFNIHQCEERKNQANQPPP